MNRNAACLFGGALMFAGVPAIAGDVASLSFDGTLEATESSFASGNYLGLSYAYYAGGISVDTHSFTVTEASQVQIDALSFRMFDSFFDTILRLYADDGSGPSAATLVTLGDDHFIGGDLNGSLSPLDSFIDVFLAPGEYTVAIGVLGLTDDEAAAGSSDGALFSTESGVPTTGRYRLDVYGSVVPAPGPAALLAFGGLALVRRRR